MSFRTSILSTAAAMAVLATGTAMAAPKTQPSRPMFAVQPGLRPNVQLPAAFPTWNFTFTYQGQHFSDTFVGAAPTGGASTTIPVVIVPVKMVYGKTSYSTSAKVTGGQTVLQNTVASPIFQSSVDYVQGGTDIGKTQYVDAFQRANLWGVVSSKQGYHTLLGTPKVVKEQVFKVPSGSGSLGNEFGVNVIEADINWFDNKLQSTIAKLKIPANTLPIFVTTQTYLTSNGCCIGGYHSYNGTLAYSMFTYIQKAGVFSQDVSALSHEISEWMDDPLTNNNSPCGIYEVGDPLEGEANYGGYPYTTNGFTYNLQDEVTPVYFGAPASTTVHGYATFQGTKLSVCQNGA